MLARTLCFTSLTASLVMVAAPAAAGALDDFRRAFAEAVHAASPELVHGRNPQALLRAVVVLNIKLREDGRLAADVLRTNDQQPEMLQRALETVSRVRLPAVPESLRDELRRNGFCETWLFDKDGSFQVMTLAKPQRNTL